jgi:uncharacterized protein
MILVFILTAASLTLSTQTLAASFDCTKARSATEVLICSDQRLSAADERLAAAYKAALARTSYNSTVRDAQRGWLKSYEVKTCKEVSCLYESFVAREQLLKRITNDEKSASWTGAYVRLFRGKVDPSATITLL